MARGVNKVILVGHLGQDPESRHTPSGLAVCNVSLATTEFRKNQETGERVDRTEWHRLVFFGRLAEVICEYANKGSQIYVEGRLRTNKWQDQEGRDRQTTEIVVIDMNLLSRKDDAQPRARSMSDDVGRSAAPSPENSPPAESGTLDDEIPF